MTNQERKRGGSLLTAGWIHWGRHVWDDSHGTFSSSCEYTADTTLVPYCCPMIHLLALVPPYIHTCSIHVPYPYSPY